MLKCTNIQCRWNKEGHCKLGGEIDELIDDYGAGDIPKDCTYRREIEEATKDFTS